MAEMKFHTFEFFLKNKGLRCVNVIQNQFDVYYIGLLKWDDMKILDEGYIIRYPCDENDFTRYMSMLEKADKIKHVL